MRMELKKMHLKMKTTTIYVTHDQIEAMTLADRIVILKDGKVQQVGTPVEVYEQPDNRFVAGFIGNPPINMLPAVVSRGSEADEISFCGLTFPVSLPAGCKDQDQVLAGIRPDSIKRDGALAALPEQWLIDGKVVVAEIVGSQSLLEFTMGEASIIAELEGRVAAAPGQTMKLGLNLENLLLFDPETEQAIR
jgi:multiple sugar transport system ATP-binding protein